MPGVLDDVAIKLLNNELYPGPTGTCRYPTPVTEMELNVPYVRPVTLAVPSFPVATVVIAPPFTPASCSAIVTVTASAFAASIKNDEASPMIENAASAALSFDFMASHPSEQTAAAATSMALTEFPRIITLLA